MWLLPLPKVKFPAAVATIFMRISSLRVPQSTTKHFGLCSGVQVTTALVPSVLTLILPGKPVNKYTIRYERTGKQSVPSPISVFLFFSDSPEDSSLSSCHVGDRIQ